ncbi:hypothetical protein [Arthrobacter sp. ES1]|uniref:hypothetical protein n=1 Tax=Arthrobacter sp. ES1 TaxID=1897056 RepID=UPI001CFFB8DB|nr:hypothetical protein [Arthrobacter sp. ES1]MCB5280372.1 hypothetical protein [Arthrobacter sp. ES1]
MKVAGMKMTDPWASRVLRNKGVETELVSGAPVETVVQMERVDIEHHGPEKNYRPLLHLTGELVSILPAEALPHGVEEVTFRSGLGPTVDAFYEFDDAQLGQLVSKGYFTEGFQAPSSMAGIPWELPTTIDALVLRPEQEGDTPVVFVTIHGQTELALDFENSGYDLAEYFENQLTAEAQQERALEGGQGIVPTRSGEINDLFAADEFRLPDAGELRDAAARFPGRAKPSSGDYPVVRASIFEDLMAEFGDKLPAVPDTAVTAGETVEPEDLAAQPAEPEVDAAEAIYRERIVPGVAKALALPGETVSDAEALKLEESMAAVTGAGDPSEAPASEPGLLDLYEEEEELDVVPVATAPAVEPVWTPDSESQTGTENEADPDDVPQPLRRVQRAQAHERALELNRDEADEPELG